MSTYVMSDLHGNYEGYLQHMMLHPNIYPILGNHEYAAGICLLELLKKIQDRTKSILIITTSQSTVVPDMMDVWAVFVWIHLKSFLLRRNREITHFNF